MTDSQDNARPRWARELSEQQWDTIHTLMDEGYPAAAIRQKADVPNSQRRSLELYVRRHGPRRRLTRFAAFKEALLGNVEEFGASFTQALTMIARMAVDPDVKSTTQLRAIEAMTQFTSVLNKLMDADRAEESARQREEGKTGGIDPSDIVRRVLDEYDVAPDR